MSLDDHHLVETIDFNRLSPEDIDSVIAEKKISLSADEASHIQNHILKRPPTLTECLLWGIEGSEHCSYKSSKTHLKKLPIKASNILVGIGEDAGVIKIATDNAGMHYGVAISHESHNHPSQIVPFEGAATGVGGNVRDIACMGATVVALADGLRFGDIRQAKTHWLSHGVVDGIASYGNALGIPNLAGDVYYHENYADNCLVTVVSLGIVREDRIIHSYVPDNANGYALILVGKPTDNSGFGGASFASADLDEDNVNRGAVQEPNAFLERHLLKANQALIDKLAEMNVLDKVAFKDLGAGGIACASVELADGNGFGAKVCIDDVHVSLDNLHPSVILCAETQERFMWAVPQDLVDTVLTHYNEDYDLPHVSSGARAVVVGEVCDDGQYVVTYRGQTLVEARARDVTDGLTVDRAYERPSLPDITQDVSWPQDLNEVLLKLLAQPQIASHKAIYEHYDKQVQGRTIIERGQARAGLLAPFNSDDFPTEIRRTGVSLAIYQNPMMNLADSYLGAKQAVVRVMERTASIGASPQALTDCLCYGNPEKKAHMSQFVAGVEGIADAAKAYRLLEDKDSTIPLAAGNVSFYNASGENAIPPSPMLSCLGRMPDVSKACDYSFKSTDSVICLVSAEACYLGGSALLSILDNGKDKPCDINAALIEKQIHFIINAIQQGLVLSCNTIEDGGLAVAISVMAATSQIGVSIDLQHFTEPHARLFSENGGFVFEIAKDNMRRIEELSDAHQVTLHRLGETNASDGIKVKGLIDINIDAAKQVWSQSLREALL